MYGATDRGFNTSWPKVVANTPFSNSIWLPVYASVTSVASSNTTWSKMDIEYSLGIVSVTLLPLPAVATWDKVIVPLLLEPVIVIFLTVAPTGIPVPVILCPVPSSKCVSCLVLVPPVSSNVLVPPAGVDAPESTIYVNCVVDVTVIFFEPL